MQLTEADTQHVLQWLNKQAPEAPLRCFVCGLGAWTILPFGNMPVGYDVHSGRINYMVGTPMIGLACNNCGHIEWFSANVIGLQPIPPATEVARNESDKSEASDAPVTAGE